MQLSSPALVLISVSPTASPGKWAAEAGDDWMSPWSGWGGGLAAYSETPQTRHTARHDLREDVRKERRHLVLKGT